MDIPTRQDILRLIEETEGPCVSLYMPTHRMGAETLDDRIRLKNLLTTAENALVDGGMRRTLAIDMLAPVAALETDADFWQHQSDGLAIFLTERGFDEYRVPISFSDRVFVQPRFHVKPLLPLLSADFSFHVLAVSANRTHVLACTPNSEAEAQVEDMPRNIAEVLWPDDTEKQLQFRTFSGEGSGQTTIFHGAGGSEPQPKEDLLRYFREVDRTLTPYLREHGGPLVLACVDYLAPIYREANSYADLLDAHVGGNPDQDQDSFLRDRAWELVRPRLDAARDDALGRYRAQAGTGRTTSDPGEAALAAATGRVDTAFVTVGMQVWGKVDVAAFKSERHDEPEEGDHDLLDLIAAHTLSARGTVYAVDEASAPEPSGVAAVFRY